MSDAEEEEREEQEEQEKEQKEEEDDDHAEIDLSFLRAPLDSENCVNLERVLIRVEKTSTNACPSLICVLTEDASMKWAVTAAAAKRYVQLPSRKHPILVKLQIRVYYTVHLEAIQMILTCNHCFPSRRVSNRLDRVRNAWTSTSVPDSQILASLPAGTRPAVSSALVRSASLWRQTRALAWIWTNALPVVTPANMDASICRDPTAAPVPTATGKTARDASTKTSARCGRARRGYELY